RGWFYTTQHVDISLNNVKHFKFNNLNPEAEGKENREKENQKRFIGDLRNDTALAGKTVVDQDATMRDFYNENDEFTTFESDKKEHDDYLKSLSDEEKKLLNSGLNFYELSFSNIGGLVMPVILEFTFSDGSTEIQRMPAEIWLQNEEAFTKVFAFEKKVSKVELDPFLETAD